MSMVKKKRGLGSLGVDVLLSAAKTESAISNSEAQTNSDRSLQNLPIELIRQSCGLLAEDEKNTANDNVAIDEELREELLWLQELELRLLLRYELLQRQNEKTTVDSYALLANLSMLGERSSAAS